METEQGGHASLTEKFSLSAKATLQLARGSCLPIASLLTLPDAVALIPGSQSLVGWALHVLAIWLTCAVIWFTGFIVILQFVRMLTGGVELNDQGIKLWRLARLIPWNKLQGVECEPQMVFTRLFTLTEPAQRLTLFELKQPLRKKGAPYLVPHNLPSFFFDHREFNRLFAAVVRRRYEFPIQTTYALVTEAEQLPLFSSAHGKMRLQKILLPCLIAFGLVMLLGRKAAGNFEFNCGNQAMAVGNYEKAQEFFQQATRIDPAFPAAWDYLGNAEFRQGKAAIAKEHWQRALFLKPDFVEAKVSLAYLKLQERQFQDALDLLNSALRLDPMNSYALVNRADCDMHQGHYKEAIEDARMVYTQESDPRSPMRYMSVCLMAQGKAKSGHAQAALRMLELQAPTDPERSRGCSLAFRYIVTSEIYRALNRPADAKKAIDQAFKLAPKSAAVLLEKARVLISLKDYKPARRALDDATQLDPSDPWPIITEAEIKSREGKLDDVKKAVQSALANHAQDAESLAHLAKLSLDLGLATQALDLAQQSLTMEPNCREASVVIRDLHDCEIRKQSSK